ncbi:MAG TPA: 30S ribosomal protein S1, partial [Spongiibacteraceae bacterium]|nr:30S ribosomal protein S1 [Spongiibacteraceae bacterium]
NERGELKLQIGDEVQVALEAVEDGWGETRLSREKAKRAEAWKDLEKACEQEAVVKGVINGKVKGGFTVDINTIRAFLPGSLVDVRPVRDTLHLEGKELEFKVIKLDQKRNNVVVSRRAVLEQANSAEREQLLGALQEGMAVKGVVKNLTDYGAFVDLGGVDGLLHITDMAWKRIKHPSEIVNVGDEIEVKILKFDRERNRVSLGLKQLGADPWVEITRRYPEGTRVRAKVTNLTDYGCFAELQEGVEGLVHVSEMDWTNKNIHPSKVVQVGDEIDVMVLDIDEERRRISLGIKQCQENPWDAFGRRFAKGDKISGAIKSITDFGIFIGLDGNIDGLVHLSDISWNETGEEAVRRFKKGDVIETVILSIDPERERISLGVKQLEQDPFTSYVGTNDKGSIVMGTVKEVDAKAAVITLADEIEGVLKASEISRDKVEDARNALKVGDSVEVKIISVDRKNRVIGLSVKAKDIDDEKEAVRAHREQENEQTAPATIGDLIKAQMQNQE